MTGVRSLARPALFAALALSLLALRARSARADAEGAMLKVLGGTVEVSHNETGAWEHVPADVQVAAPDRVRTAADGRAHLLLIDGSSIELGPGSDFGIERLEWDSQGKRNVAVFQLKRGAVRIAAKDRYAGPRSRFEVETPSAVVSNHAAAYLVLYDEAEQYTEVVGLEGEVEVAATLGVIGPRPAIGSGQLVRIERGKFPAPARLLDSEATNAYLARLSTGVPPPAPASAAPAPVAVPAADGERLVTAHPVLGGRVLRPEDLPDEVAKEVKARTAGRVNTADPDYPLAERLSPDVWAHEQPIPEFQAAPPGEVPTGGVEVDF